MCAAAGTGRELAALVAGRAPQVDLHPFRPERFRRFGWLGPLGSLGSLDHARTA
jgi:glycine/D-amino acid oxidase-like deaminating enzyme